MHIERNIPSRQAWGKEPWNVDKEHAYQYLGGKNIHEAMLFFIERDATVAYETFMQMPAGVFDFYIVPYCGYLASEKSEDDAAGAALFMKLIQNRVNQKPKMEDSVLKDIKSCIEYISKNAAHFSPNSSYGNEDLNLIAEQILETLAY